MKLSERVRWVVENLPISESAWSLKAGQSRGYVQKLIKRDPLRPDFNALQRMADVAGVPRAWLIGGEGDIPALGQGTIDEPASAANPPEIQMVPSSDAAPTVGGREGFDEIAAELLDATPESQRAAVEAVVGKIRQSGSMQKLDIPLTLAGLEALVKLVSRHGRR